MDEDHLRDVMVGEPTPDGAKVVIHDHDPRRPSWFADDRAVITAALGDRVQATDHVGSTLSAGPAGQSAGPAGQADHRQPPSGS